MHLTAEALCESFQGDGLPFIAVPGGPEAGRKLKGYGNSQYDPVLAGLDPRLAEFTLQTSLHKPAPASRPRRTRQPQSALRYERTTQKVLAGDV